MRVIRGECFLCLCKETFLSTVPGQNFNYNIQHFYLKITASNYFDGTMSWNKVSCFLHVTSVRGLDHSVTYVFTSTTRFQQITLHLHHVWRNVQDLGFEFTTRRNTENADFSCFILRKQVHSPKNWIVFVTRIRKIWQIVINHCCSWLCTHRESQQCVSAL